jgi:hypothetical protein
LMHLWALFAQDPSSLIQDLNLPEYNPNSKYHPFLPVSGYA